MRKTFVFVLMLAGLPAAALAADAMTAPQAKALVEGMVEAAHSHNLVKFAGFLQPDARIAVGPPDAVPPLFERLDMRHFEEALKGCAILSVSAADATRVSLETRCGARNGSPSYIILRSGKVALFYPFRSPIMMMRPG